MGHLSERALQGLQSYKYKAGGYTLLDDLHQPAWNYIVKYLPIWLAPNLITLIGTLFVLVAYALNGLYSPNFEGDAPRWVYAFSAFAVFIYIHLDCIDGKQARRTGSSSPLGQLFDHGCDALVVHMVLGNIACSLGASNTLTLAAGSLSIMVPWIMAQLEEYHTGIMVYGTRYYGVLEANYAICAVHVLTACVGPDFWQLRLADLAPLPPILNASTATTGDLSIVLVAAAGLIQAGGHVSRTLQAGPSSMPKDERGFKHLGKAAALSQIASVLTFLAFGAIWIWTAPPGTSIVRRTFSSFGILYAHAASQLIVAHMTKEPFVVSWPVFGLVCVGAVNGVLGVVDPMVASTLINLVSMVLYCGYVVSVIGDICAFLGIQCLTIPEQKAKAA